MGVVSIIGGLTSLRLPETLHERLPQTLEEGENFGKDWSFRKCLSCFSKQEEISSIESYENLDLIHSKLDRETKLENSDSVRNIHPQRASIKRLVRQMSVMDTQKNIDGTMHLTHWI